MWLAVDKEGDECSFNQKKDNKFKRYNGRWYHSNSSIGPWGWESDDDPFQYIPNGTIKKLIGRNLTWEDEPVEYCGESNSQSSCPYCEKGKDNKYFVYAGQSVALDAKITLNHKLKLRYDDWDKTYDTSEVDINYCPFCGRNLKRK